jgi:pimeloyl-ACP methyl ester carboxylesterase
MADFLLIHGSGHGAWCWRDVLPLLRAGGHTARAIDLPGLGDDATAPAEVTLASTVDAIGAALGAHTVLVGHSLGGIAITQAAEAFPDRIARLAYLTAWVPADGQSAGDLRRAWASADLRAATRISDDGTTTSFDPDAVAGLFYHDCPAEAVAFATAHLRPQPVAPARTAVTLTARAAKVPRSYVRCTGDRAIPAAAQVAFSDCWDDVHEIACGHSPFFAAPGRLAETLVAIGEAAS